MESELDVARLGRFIRGHRTVKGVSLERLAEQAGVSGGYLSKIETGRIESPDVRYLARIGQALGVSVGEMLAEAGLAAHVLPELADYLRIKLGLPDEVLPDAVKHLSDLQGRFGKKRRRKPKEGA